MNLGNMELLIQVIKEQPTTHQATNKFTNTLAPL